MPLALPLELKKKAPLIRTAEEVHSNKTNAEFTTYPGPPPVPNVNDDDTQVFIPPAPIAPMPPSVPSPDVFMNEVKTWILDLEAIRDDIYLMSVKNAVLLDSLAMAGECTGIYDVRACDGMEE
jgi:hypothetical protein